MTSSETTFNDAELIARLRDAHADGLGTENLCLEVKLAENEVRLRKAEELEAKLKSLTKHHANMADPRYWEGRYRDEKNLLAKAVEALEALIQLAHDCEKELTEDLHHMDFCGESEPLTKARATLAEIKAP